MLKFSETGNRKKLDKLRAMAIAYIDSVVDQQPYYTLIDDQELTFDTLYYEEVPVFTNSEGLKVIATGLARDKEDDIVVTGVLTGRYFPTKVAALLKDLPSDDITIIADYLKLREEFLSLKATRRKITLEEALQLPEWKEQVEEWQSDARDHQEELIGFYLYHELFIILAIAENGKRSFVVITEFMYPYSSSLELAEECLLELEYEQIVQHNHGTEEGTEKEYESDDEFEEEKD